MLLTGCDFFRSLVGKPTSKDLERMRQEAMEQERQQREQDSLNRVRALELEQARIGWRAMLRRCMPRWRKTATSPE